jgi:predicted MFS family arabinose efflux permease
VLITTLTGILAGYLAYTYVAPISEHAGARGGGVLAAVLASFGVGAAAGSLLSGAGVDHLDQRTVVRIAAGTQALALAVLAALNLASAHLGSVPVALAFVLLGAGSFNYNVPQQHRLIELAPDSATTVVSLNSSAIYAGIGLSGALGELTLQAGPGANCLAGVGLALLTGLIAGPLRVLRPRAPASKPDVTRRRHTDGYRTLPDLKGGEADAHIRGWSKRGDWAAPGADADRRRPRRRRDDTVAWEDRETRRARC